MQHSLAGNDSLGVGVGSTPLAEGLNNVDESAVVLHAALGTSDLLLLLLLGVNLIIGEKKKVFMVILQIVMQNSWQILICSKELRLVKGFK